MKTLFLGDPHVTVTNLKESERLMEFVIQQRFQAGNLIILGDLFHNHANVRVEVLEFWSRWFVRLSDVFNNVFVLVGNHDMVGDFNSKSHSLSVFTDLYDNFYIIDSPTTLNGFGYMPYIHDKTDFVRQANELCSKGAKVIVCHGEFAGVKYESGLQVLNGTQASGINASLIISGHYHSRQRFDNVIYPGTARWLTAADKNEPKGLWLADFDNSCNLVSEEFLDTSKVCTPIYAYEFKEGDNCPEIPEGSRASVELIGPSEWVLKQKAKFKGIASISAKITDRQKASNRKSGNSLEHFVNNVFETNKSIKKERMVEFMKELGVL